MTVGAADTSKQFDLTQPASELLEFVQERDWVAYQSPKNLLLALVGEVGELASLFQWLTPEEADNAATGPDATEVVQEIADVQLYLLRLCQVLGVSLQDALHRKLEINRRRYPVLLARGRRTKYTELRAAGDLRRA